MSGNYGWGGNDRSGSFSSRNSRNDSGFSRANQAYTSTPQPAYSQAAYSQAAGPSMAMSGTQSRLTRPVVDLNPKRSLKTTKDNVIVVWLDETGSMGDRRQQIIDRCGLFFGEAKKFLGESVEIIFGAFGDTRLCGDKIEVCPPGSGPELDTYLKAICLSADGGGNMHESSDLGLYYSLQQIDTSTAKQVYCFVVTDEMAYETLDEADVQCVLGLRLNSEMRQTSTVAKALIRRMNTFVIQSSYGSYGGSYRMGETRTIKESWEEILGDPTRVVQLDDARRVVDVILGVIAKTTGQFTQFSQDLSARQSGTQYGKVNISTVQQSLSTVRGVPTPPTASKVNPAKSLLLGSLGATPDPDPVPAAPTGGSKSLLK